MIAKLFLSVAVSIPLLDEPRTEIEWARWIAANAFETAPEVEFRLWDGSRVDFLLNGQAIEIDWSKKWAEGIGQALYYARITGKKPVVLLLSTNPTEDAKHHYRATVAAGDTVKLWIFDCSKRKWLSKPD
jgi:hypothetical protein